MVSVYRSAQVVLGVLVCVVMGLVWELNNALARCVEHDVSHHNGQVLADADPGGHLQQQLQEAQRELESVKQELRSYQESEARVQHTPPSLYSRKVVCAKSPNVRSFAAGDYVPRFVVALGVEGTGHHMLMPIMHHRSVKFEYPEGVTVHRMVGHHVKELHESIMRVQRWEEQAHESWPEEPAHGYQLYYDMIDRIDFILQQHLACGGDPGQDCPPDTVPASVMYHVKSFPFDQPRAALRRPYLVKLLELLLGQGQVGRLAGGKAFAPRMLVLQRDASATLVSTAKRRMFTNVHAQAKIQQDNLIFLNSLISILPHEWFATLSYEQFVEDPSSFEQPLSEFMGVGVDGLRAAVKAQGIRSHVGSRQPMHLEPLELRTALHMFYGVQPLRWPVMTSHRFDVRRRPSLSQQQQDGEQCVPWHVAFAVPSQGDIEVLWDGTVSNSKTSSV